MRADPPAGPPQAGFHTGAEGQVASRPRAAAVTAAGGEVPSGERPRAAAGADGPHTTAPPGAEPTGIRPPDRLVAAQREHWQLTYQRHPHMYGGEPSAPAVYAAERFRAAGARRVLELGAGHGRDTLYFARCGLRVRAADFSRSGLEQLAARAAAEGLSGRVATVVHDIRDPLPVPDASVDAVFAHMLLCMALSTSELRSAVAEISRVLRPGGVLVYTVRHTGDAHFGTGTGHGDSIFEHGGFAVHFFDRDLVHDLARGWHLAEVYPFEEGELPRRLWRVTQTKPLGTPGPASPS